MPSCSSCPFPLSVAPLGVLTSLPTAVLRFTPHGLCPPPTPPHQVSLLPSSRPQHRVHTLQRAPPKAFLNHRPAAGSRFLTTLGILVPSVWAFQAVGSPDLPPEHKTASFSQTSAVSSLALVPRSAQDAPARLCTALHGSPQPGSCLLRAPPGALGHLSTLCSAGSGRLLPIPSVTLYSLQKHLHT